MNSESVFLTGLQPGEVTMPAKCGHFGKFPTRFAVRIVEETQFDPLRDAGKQREIHAGAVVRGAKRMGLAGFQLHEKKMCRLATGDTPSRRLARGFWNLSGEFRMKEGFALTLPSDGGRV